MIAISTERARELSRELREGSSPHLRRRRGIVGHSLFAAASMGVIGLYQMGIIGHLPEPPLPGLDADEVDASPEAYRKLETPDALLGVGSYAATAVLAGMGGEDRAERSPWILLALAGKIGFDVAQGARLTHDQWAKHRAYCSWCLLATAATLATAPLVVPEARAALRRVQDG